MRSLPNDAGFELSSRLVRCKDDAVRRYPGIDKLEAFRLSPFRKKPFTSADRDGVDPDMHPIDQMTLEQPPYLKALEASSSGPPGACMTPSKVTNVDDAEFERVAKLFAPKDDEVKSAYE